MVGTLALVQFLHNRRIQLDRFPRHKRVENGKRVVDVRHEDDAQLIVQPRYYADRGVDAHQARCAEQLQLSFCGKHQCGVVPGAVTCSR